MTDTFIDGGVAVLSEAQAARYLGLSLATFKRRRADGGVPKPIQLSKRRIGYRRATLDAWLAAREVTS